MMTNSDITDATELIAWGLRPKMRPARVERYGDLVQRADSDPEFLTTVEAAARGLGMLVLSVDRAVGVVLASTEDSVFGVKMTDYAKRTATEGRSAERVLHALAHLGAAVMAFPRPADLGSPTYIGRITVNGVNAFLHEAARRLGEAAAEAGDPDPVADHPDLQLAWQVYSRRASTPLTGDGRRQSSATIGMVGKALTFLTDQGMLVKRSDGEGGTYVTTGRYRIQMLDAGQRMFEELLALGIAEISDGSGTLMPITWTRADVDML